MTTRKKIKHKSRMFAGLLAKIALLVSFTAEAQEESMEERRRLKNERHVGYSLSSGARRHGNDVYVLDVRAIHRASKGAGSVKDHHDEARPTVGLRYASTPLSYSLDVLDGSVSGNFYLLKLRRSDDHLLEPYVSISASVRSLVVEDYLLEKASRRLAAFGEHVPGHQTGGGESRVSLGVQYQLKNRSARPLRLFTELRYGDSLIDRSTTRFANADTRQPFTVALGVNFGKIR